METSVETPVTSRNVALIGNPNSGKSTLFNALTGLKAQTANFPGTTVEHKRGRTRIGDAEATLVDLPGAYSLQAATPDEQITSDLLLGCLPKVPVPDALVVVVDASNLERNLFLAGQVLELSMPTVVALTMNDIARQHGMHVDADTLADTLGCPVVPVHARRGEGLDALRRAIDDVLRPDAAGGREAAGNPVCEAISRCSSCSTCAFHGRFNWTEEVTAKVVKGEGRTTQQRTDKLDAMLTHPVLGAFAFVVVMLGIFYLIFAVAKIPMELIDVLFGRVQQGVASLLPAGDFNSLLSEGVVGGVGGMLVFLPQIAILFFFLALLEDTGYLARAAFVMDRLMRWVGLPGTAFVPMVSAHACAIPAIMASRIIGDRRDRLLTILILPLLTCSARIPVYAMVVALLFPDHPIRAAAVFCGAFVLGIVAALLVAAVFRRTLVGGESKPLILELPGYKLPSLRNAFLVTLDRSWIFVKQAGTIILLLSIGLWVLATYPKSDPPPEAAQLLAQAGAAATPEEAKSLADEASNLVHRHALEHSIAGRLGKLIEPVVRPLGFDWQIGIGVISSFAAREVIVSTLSIVYGLGEDGADETDSLYDTLRRAERPDGSRIFNPATCLSLLVFYVLAMQCLPTQAVTKRETGSWKWALFQLGYMTVLAYSAALVTYQVASRLL